jgi:undecaprenyl-diphosphatase
MELLKALLLGIIEGLTEFLPISSTGHLILAGKVLRFEGPVAETFEIFIQLGAILAVVVLYWPRFIALLDFGHSEDKNSGFSGITGVMKLFVGCLPAFVLGALLHKLIKTHLFGPTTVAAALVFGGLVMIAVEKRARPVPCRSLEDISYGKCLTVGFFQCFALWPGISRSGATIVGSMLVGIDRTLAAEFSFLLAVPVMTAAVGFDLLKSLSILSLSDVPLFVLGFVAAFMFAMLAIRFFIALLNRWTLVPFGIYRIVLGALVLYACASTP